MCSQTHVSIRPLLMQPINIYVPPVPEQTGQDALIQRELRLRTPTKPEELLAERPCIALTMQTSASTPFPRPFVSFQNSRASPDPAS